MGRHVVTPALALAALLCAGCGEGTLSAEGMRSADAETSDTGLDPLGRDPTPEAGVLGDAHLADALGPRDATPPLDAQVDTDGRAPEDGGAPGDGPAPADAGAARDVATPSDEGPALEDSGQPPPDQGSPDAARPDPDAARPDPDAARPDPDMALPPEDMGPIPDVPVEPDIPEPPPAPDPPALQVREAGAGLQRVISVEIPEELRLGFEARLGYGPTQWFDLVHAPDRDIAHYPLEPNHVTEQGSIANHVFYPEDYHAHHHALELFHQNLPRTGTIVEQSDVRAILETSSFPVVNHEATRDIEVLTRYAIYADGRVAIRSTIAVHQNHNFSQWRLCVLGVGDPTYQLEWASGNNAVLAGGAALRIPNAGWEPDQWAGFVVEQPGYHIFEIVSNTADTLRLGGNTAGLADGGWTIRSANNTYGWVRGIDHQDPFVYTEDPVDYLTLRWDPATRAPYTHWSRASAVLARWKGENPPYFVNVHSWDGFKRHYFALNNVRFVAGQDVVHRFLLRLGTRAATALPDLSDRQVAAASVRDYLAPQGRLTVGGNALAFEPDDLTWVAVGGPGDIPVHVARAVEHPVFRVPGVAEVTAVRRGGENLSFRAAEAANGDQVVIVWASLPQGADITLRTR